MKKAILIAVIMFVFVGGTRSQSRYFDGTDDTMNLAPVAPLDASIQRITIEFWVNKNAYGAPDTWACVAGQSGTITLICLNNVASYGLKRIAVEWRNAENTSGMWWVYTNCPVIEAGLWTHVAWTYNRASNTKLYINGDLVETQALGDCPTGLMKITSNLAISGDGDGNAELDGSLDEFRVWSCERTVEQIRDYMNQEIPDNCPYLVYYYRMNETTGRLYDCKNKIYSTVTGTSARNNAPKVMRFK